MQNYIDLLKKCVREGNIRTDRTNTGTISLFGPQLEFDLAKGFPLDTSRKIFLRGDLEELFWMLRGSTDNNELVDKNVHIWDAWALRQEDIDNHPNPLGMKVGALGPVYGEQWAAWPDPANDVEIVLTIEERIQLAEDYLSVGAAEKFTQAGLDDLKDDWSKAVDEINNPEAARYGITTQHVETRLTRFNIPRTRSKKATINQIAKVIEDLKVRPNSRRHIVSAWNVAYLPDESMSPQQNVLHGKMALAPCHTLFQYYVEDRTINEMLEELSEEDQLACKWFLKDNQLFDFKAPRPDIDLGISPAYWEFMFNFEKKKLITDWFEVKGIKTRKLSCKLYQRSADGVLGASFNIAAYAAQTMMVAQCVDMAPGRFIHTFGDFHIYKNHLLPNADGESVFTQFAREERPLPKLIIDPSIKNIFDFKYEHFTLVGYEPHPKISYPVAV